MTDYASKDIRNIAAVGHGGSGKTTLCDYMLFKAGQVTRAGSVSEKNSTFDFEEEEKERQSSIYTALAFCDWKGSHLNLIDTPGYTDFVGSALCGLSAADTAVLVISAAHGLELNTRRMWAAAAARGMARVIVISRMDADNIPDYPGLVAKIRESFGQECVRVNLPNGVGPAFKGITDVLQPPADASAEVKAAAGALMDRIVENDEKIMERYLNDEKIAPEELSAALRKAVVAGKLVPILHVNGRTGEGVETLMDFLAAYTPSPLEVPAAEAKDVKSGDAVKLSQDASAQFAGHVFKTITDPFVGKLSFFRILQGTCPHETHFYNPRTERNERVAQIFKPFGKEIKPVAQGIVGDLLAVTKIEDMLVGDTVCNATHPVALPPITLPTPMVSLAVQPKARGDEQKISSALKKLSDEDPTFKVTRDQQTGELVVIGMSQLHLDLLLHRLHRRFGVDVTTRTPRIPYKETVTVPSEGMYRHKKQTGGRGQFAEVWFKMEPLPRSAGFEFEDAVVGGSVPNQFIPAVEKGVRETLAKGVLAGYPVEDVKVILHFGKFHDVDSSEAAFKLAASMCFHEVFMKGKPALLEPIVNIEITVPSQYMGDISGDLNSRRGRIIGMDADGDMQIIRAQVPLGEITTYATELRSMTGGTGGYTMEFSHYDLVPSRFAEGVIASAKKAATEAH